jgi:Protein of unknown function (DUF2474)
MPLVASKSSWCRQVAWFVAIWAVSVTGLALVALAFRLIMTFAGLTPG